MRSWIRLENRIERLDRLAKSPAIGLKKSAICIRSLALGW